VAKKQFYTVSEAAAAKKVTRGAIHEAIKKRPLARRMDHDRASGGLTLKAARFLADITNACLFTRQSSSFRAGDGRASWGKLPSGAFSVFTGSGMSLQAC
jgi:hypothetical protein